MSPSTIPQAFVALACNGYAMLPGGDGDGGDDADDGGDGDVDGGDDDDDGGDDATCV